LWAIRHPGEAAARRHLCFSLLQTCMWDQSRAASSLGRSMRPLSVWSRCRSHPPLHPPPSHLPAPSSFCFCFTPCLPDGFVPVLFSPFTFFFRKPASLLHRLNRLLVAVRPFVDVSRASFPRCPCLRLTPSGLVQGQVPPLRGDDMASHEVGRPIHCRGPSGGSVARAMFRFASSSS
jgi:hypothetical protein